MLPSPYVLLAALVGYIAVAVGGYWYGGHVTALDYKAQIAKQNADANALLAQLTQTAFAKDQAASEYARTLDEQHTKDLADAQDAANSAAADYSARLRRFAASRASCPGPGTAQATNPGVGKNAPTGGQPGLPEALGRQFAEIGNAANRLAAYARECHAFAVSVGR